MTWLLRFLKPPMGGFSSDPVARLLAQPFFLLTRKGARNLWDLIQKEQTHFTALAGGLAFLLTFKLGYSAAMAKHHHVPTDSPAPMSTQELHQLKTELLLHGFAPRFIPRDFPELQKQVRTAPPGVIAHWPGHGGLLVVDSALWIHSSLIQSRNAARNRSSPIPWEKLSSQKPDRLAPFLKEWLAMIDPHLSAAPNATPPKTSRGAAPLLPRQREHPISIANWRSL